MFFIRRKWKSWISIDSLLLKLFIGSHAVCFWFSSYFFDNFKSSNSGEPNSLIAQSNQNIESSVEASNETTQRIYRSVNANKQIWTGAFRDLEIDSQFQCSSWPSTIDHVKWPLKKQIKSGNSFVMLKDRNDCTAFVDVVHVCVCILIEQ